ncbi:MAG: copper resistance system multicopper oxidase [Gammaproteobacteria bacterium]|nr:MAG: copper resistance system multicopper oxidase [Gammaproteobacteria bacterium]
MVGSAGRHILSRRSFVTGVAAGGTVLGMGYGGRPARAAQPISAQRQLTGKRFELELESRDVNFTGRVRSATVVDGSLPGPILRWREGDTVRLRVTNRLAVDSSIHWHGIIVPTAMDGVPGLSFAGIRPGDSFEYEFTVRQSGTYWYHSHTVFQEPTGMYGPLIIDPLEPDPFTYDRDYVVMLSDWSDDRPEQIYARLKKLSHYYNFQQRTIADVGRDVRETGLAATWRQRAMWNRMRMSDTDISDVTGYAYTFLMNGQTPEQGWTGLFNPGEKIRLRFINAAAMTFFDVRIPGVKMTVVAADGQNIRPVTVDEFRIGVAETYDVIVEPGDGAHTIFAQSIDRSGFASGALTTDAGLAAAVPTMDSPPVLTHADMGMRHVGEHAGHDMGPGVSHPQTEYGPNVDMRAEMPMYRLHDPGIGLRDNGRRVLTYADLRNLNPTADARPPDRAIELHLTGNMSRYMWSINGVKFTDAKPLELQYGERVRITLVNDTMMHHPMHLHGLWSELETGDNAYLPRKHTVIVPPGSKISYRVSADSRGRWAFHCHLVYHMLGMFREVVVS